MDKIIYNRDIDFSLFIKILGNLDNYYQEIKKLKKNSPYIIDEKKIGDFYEETKFFYKNLSFVEKKIIETYFFKTDLFSSFLFFLSINKIDIDLISIKYFEKFIYNYYEIEKSDNSLQRLEKVKAKDEFSQNSTDINKTFNLIEELLADNSLLDVFKVDTKKINKKIKDSLYEGKKEDIKQQLSFYQNLYETDENNFFKKINLFYTNVNLDGMQPYLSYLSPFTSLVSMNSSSFIFGYSLFENLKEDDEKYYILLSKFLSEPKRYKIIKLLSKKKYYSNELAKALNLTAATMNYHINKLYDLGLLNIDQGKQNRLFLQLNVKRLNYLLDGMKKNLLN